jgi:putative flippase GtrA
MIWNARFTFKSNFSDMELLAYLKFGVSQTPRYKIKMVMQKQLLRTVHYWLTKT